jgi:7-cyano-7-deazaguanine synthase
MSGICMGLSGGMDSATMLATILDSWEHDKKKIFCLGFTYGSKHNKYENKAAIDIANYYGVDYKLINLEESIGKLFKSDLLLSGGEIPEGHYNDESMSRTVVPGRNIIFASILAGYAWSKDCNQIALGVHLGDRHVYADCRPEFIKALDSAIYLGTGHRVEVVSPFIKMNKIDICRVGLALEVPYELSRTCYSDQEENCGRCGACSERLEAFKLNNAIDPVKYQEV